MTSRDFVSARLREAWDTLRRLPGDTVPALRSTWPEAIQDIADAYGYTPATVSLPPPSPRAIDRMTESFTWFKALEDHPHLTRAAWLTSASGMGIRRAALTLGLHRDTVRARRDEALDRMADHVRRTHARESHH